MKRTVAELLAAAFVCTVLTAVVTWPQIRYFTSDLIGHHDSYFSIWRLAWIAHALATSPSDLLNGNIFYPAERTLTYSDAMLLQGVLAAPLFWIGLPSIAIYNTMLFAGFVGSGVGVYVLARHLTSAAGASLVAAAAFTLAPYRIEHSMHLELQWAMWVPLTLWALHVACERGSIRFGALAGVFCALQVFSCVYYGVFLALLLLVFVPGLLLITGRLRSSVAPLAVAALAALVLIAPYAIQYLRSSDILGARDPRDVAQYSAHWWNYLASTIYHRFWGWTADRWGSSELRLFPGLIVVMLAAAGLLNRRRRVWLLYFVCAAAAVVLSFGVNAPIYRWLFDHVRALEGLRSISRFALLAMCAMAVLAALGTQAIAERWRRVPAVWIAALCIVLSTIDVSTRSLPVWGGQFVREADVYKVIRSGGKGVVIEIPMPRLNSLPGWDAYYVLWSVAHWQPLVNGYSGYYPPDYVQTLLRMATFPDDASVARLRAHDVRYIVIHRDFLQPDQYTSLMLRMAEWTDFKFWGYYTDPVGMSALWVMEPRQ
jgi:hypothetical protein